MKIIDEINKYRDVPLVVSEALAIEASRFAVHMSMAGTLVHKRNTVLLATYPCTVEVSEVVRMWFGSDRRDIMLNPYFTRAGFAHCHYFKDDTRWWCVVLGV